MTTIRAIVFIPGGKIEINGQGGIGNCSNGEWMAYTVNVTEAGAYTIELLSASPSDNRSYQYMVDRRTRCRFRDHPRRSRTLHCPCRRTGLQSCRKINPTRKHIPPNTHKGRAVARPFSSYKSWKNGKNERKGLGKTAGDELIYCVASIYVYGREGLVYFSAIGASALQRSAVC